MKPKEKNRGPGSLRVFPDAQICAFWQMTRKMNWHCDTLEAKNACQNKFTHSQSSNNIYLCQLVKLLQKAFTGYMSDLFISYLLNILISSSILSSKRKK